MFVECRMCFFVASICAVISIRSLVLARDDAVGALVVFSGCLLVFKTDEHKNKRGIECSNVCSNELDIHLFIQCSAPMVR